MFCAWHDVLWNGQIYTTDHIHYRMYLSFFDGKNTTFSLLESFRDTMSTMYNSTAKKN